MTHFEERLQADIDSIRAGVIGIGRSVERGLETAIEALLTLDRDLAFRTIIDDHPINREVERVDRLCHYFVARHLPSAGHLRFISSVLRMNVELERIGDYAVAVAREAAALKKPVEEPLRGEIEQMSGDALRMYRLALAAFDERNVDLARDTMKSAKTVDVEFLTAYDDLVREGREGAAVISDLLGKLIVIYTIDRVGAQAKNLCEEVVFALTGERKKRRPVRVLFLDHKNDAASQVAAAIGRKAFATTGIFESAGIEPAAGIDPLLVRFMEEHGHDLSGARPQSIEAAVHSWRDVDAIVSLEGPWTEYVDDLPTGPVAFAWPMPVVDPAAREEERSESYRAVFQEAAVRVRDLMETMRGSEEEQ